MIRHGSLMRINIYLKIIEINACIYILQMSVEEKNLEIEEQLLKKMMKRNSGQRR